MSTDRLRQHPEERLAAPIQLIDLAASADRLRAEPHPAVSGHRQIAVFRHGPVTLVQFVFEPEGVLKEHKADGVVTIHVTRGHLNVVAEDQAYDLPAGRVLALAPGVPHTVQALTASELLLSVHRGG